MSEQQKTRCLLCKDYNKTRPTFKWITNILAILLVGFVGGAITPWALGWIKNTAGLASQSSDAIAVANTYIVFTTIIFVGVTVILAVVGYVVTQQFSEHKELQLNKLTDDLKELAKKDEKFGVVLISGLLENSSVKDLIDEKIAEKITQQIQETLDSAQKEASKASEREKAIASVSSQLKNSNGE